MNHHIFTVIIWDCNHLCHCCPKLRRWAQAVVPKTRQPRPGRDSHSRCCRRRRISTLLIMSVNELVSIHSLEGRTSRCLCRTSSRSWDRIFDHWVVPDLGFDAPRAMPPLVWRPCRLDRRDAVMCVWEIGRRDRWDVLRSVSEALWVNQPETPSKPTFLLSLLLLPLLLTMMMKVDGTSPLWKQTC